MGIAAGRCGRNYRLVIQRTIPLVRLVCWLSGEERMSMFAISLFNFSYKNRNTDEYKKMIRSVFQSMKLSPSSESLIERNRVGNFRQVVGHLIYLCFQQGLLGCQHFQVSGRPVFHE